MAQAPLQSPFYYYNPESDKVRQQQLQQQQSHFMHMQPQHNDYFSQPYTPTRPQSSHTAPQMVFHQQPQYISQAMLTPVSSPSRDIHQRPTILVQQELPYGMMHMDNEYRFGPATPTLSSTSSVSADSPQNASYPLLPTPGNDMYLASFDGLKHGCEEEMFNDVLNGGDWSKSASPPMTPGKTGISHSLETIAAALSYTWLQLAPKINRNLSTSGP